MVAKLHYREASWAPSRVPPYPTKLDDGNGRYMFSPMDEGRLVCAYNDKGRKGRGAMMLTKSVGFAGSANAVVAGWFAGAVLALYLAVVYPL